MWSRFFNKNIAIRLTIVTSIGAQVAMLSYLEQSKFNKPHPKDQKPKESPPMQDELSSLITSFRKA